MIGTANDKAELGGEKPQHASRVSPFEMLSTPVTRERFALFDPNLQGEHQKEILSVDRRWVDQGPDSFWSFCVNYHISILSLMNSDAVDLIDPVRLSGIQNDHD